MSITIHDKELPVLRRLLVLVAHQSDPEISHLCYRLLQRVEARLHEIGNPALPLS